MSRDECRARTRVVHVSLGLGMGGMEKLLLEFARRADRRRFELVFVSLTSPGIMAGELERLGWRVVALGAAPGLRPRLMFRLAGLFRELGADVVHTHNTKPLIYAAPAARLARVPTVVHTRHGQRYQAGWKINLLFRWVARLTSHFVCVSRDSAACSAEEGVAPQKVRTVWNGIDLGNFSYSGPASRGPAVMVGRLSPEKDVATLVRAAAVAVQTDPSFRLQVVGDGQCLPELRRLAWGLGVSGHVEFLGQLRDVRQVLAGASLFVLPSLTEGISLTLLEAMARGLPVVATRVGGNPEVVADGETGLLVPTAGPAELATAMLRLFRDPDEARRMGSAGRRRVEEHFDARRMVADYESLYLDRPDRVPGSRATVSAEALAPAG